MLAFPPSDVIQAKDALGRASSDLQKQRKYSVVSLFSGCGGMDLGFKGGFIYNKKRFKKLPFEIIWANEINKAACNTYRKNIGSHIVEGDIWENINKIPEYADVVIGGFPCQDISVNGKGAGIKGKKSSLYRAMVEVIARQKPKIFVAENVKGLLMKHHRNALEQVLKDFSQLGYDVTYHLYHSADYGVAQTRERVMIVGTRNNVSPFSIPSPILTPEKYVTAFDILDDLSLIDENPNINHIWSRASRSPEQGDRRLLAERPGYTMRAECHGNIHWHYSQPRRISMREAARIQSFPDNFVFHSGLREMERQIGNAVPPVLAWHVAKAVLRSLEEI
ncbi:MAG: DNA cytosine methyltransferase [Acetobacter sp.]|jgi:DNA (cytosine-5)-methyltransferase 1|uniref:DNA cytosine methyltransferase n=1 Tax=Acetobacter sp. TaxID=440 RepID=UPI0039E7F509